MWSFIALLISTAYNSLPKMNAFYIDFHHGGKFDDMDTYVGGIMSIWKCDGDRWSYFEILDVIKEMGYPGVLEMWYDFVGTLKELVNDFGAIEMLNWCKNNEKVNLYIVHPISQPDVVNVVDVQPVLTYVQPTEQKTEANSRYLILTPFLRYLTLTPCLRYLNKMKKLLRVTLMNKVMIMH